MYDLLSGVYPVSSYLFHSRAHRAAVEMSGIRDGMRVLEVATGSGEMFGRLTEKNRNGHTLGIDLSPNMAARTQRLAHKHNPAARAHCQAVDARRLPFRDGAFDAVFCCYLFELLGTDDILATLAEIRPVLRPQGTFTTTLIGQNTEMFNRAYRAASRVIPSFWGRQVEARMPALIESFDFRIVRDRSHRQAYYPSRVLCCRKE
jgi:ubiquinone/menaquinone biosynthesis C-methylase UbiE